MMPFTLPARLALLLAAVLFLIGTHWRAYTQGQRHERTAAQAAQTEALRTRAVAAIRHADHTIEAQHDRAQTERRIAADHLRTAGELDRLRTDLQTARAAAAGADACTPHAPAQDQLLGAMAADIAQLAEQGAAIAAAADGHAADAVMLSKVLASCAARP